MEKRIYGIDTTKKMTPLQVRDAIVECFYQAHKAALEARTDIPAEEKEKFTKSVIINIIKDQFRNANGNFDKPTKESLFFAIMGLAGIARSFRDIDVIVSHFLEIMKLIDNL